jgi:hypothetical protein
LEVVNEKSLPIFQIFYRDDTHLVFNGVFTVPRSIIFASGETGMKVFANETLTDEDFALHVEKMGLKRLFKYPSFQFPGEFETPPHQ